MTSSSSLTHHTPSKIPYTEATRQRVSEIKARLEKCEHLWLPLQETLDLLEALTQFELGRFLLHNQGLNGYWTSVIIRHITQKTLTHSLEAWLLNRSLFVLIRERFSKLQKQLCSFIKPHACLASIPCGLMDDLLLLDYSDLKDIQLTGIDIDAESLNLARENAHRMGVQADVQFLKQDAWQLDADEAYDLIASNGLNMYESKEERLLQLYHNFYKALAPGGVLMISFVPPPPKDLDPVATFNMPLEDWRKERAIFSDIIQVKYLNFCTEETMRQHLKGAGFEVRDILYLRHGLAPLVIAVKSWRHPYLYFKNRRL